MLLFGCTSDYRNQPLKMGMQVCYLDCHEAGLCCYPVIHTENLLHLLQLLWYASYCVSIRVIHAQPIPSSPTSSFYLYLAKSKSYEAPHYASFLKSPMTSSPLWSKYSPPYPVVKHPPCFFLIKWVVRILALRPLLAYCQPRVIVKMTVEKQMECRLAGETEVLGENLPQCHFCPSQNST
jgi:hypothetical protein